MGFYSPSNLKMDHSFSGSNPTDISDVSNIPTAPGITNGVRPDPEGEVSIRSRNEKTTTADEDLDEHCGESGDSGLESDPVSPSASCFSISAGQQSGPVLDNSSLSDLSPDQEDAEKIRSSLIQLEKCELDVALRPHGDQDSFQRQNVSKDDPQQNIGSFRERILSHLGSSHGDDSGCGSCFSEDAAGADRVTSELFEEDQDTRSAESKVNSSISGAVEREEACRGVHLEFSDHLYICFNYR